MKVSKQTIEVLKNFGTINTNILIREGNVLRTMTFVKDIFAVAEVEEEFPREFAIYDLNPLLALMGMMGDDDEIDFGEKSLKIKNNKSGGVFEYYYADPGVITAAPEKTIQVDKQFSFKFTKADIEMLMKAAAVVSAPTINIISRKGTVVLTAGDPETPGSNSYRRIVGKCSAEFDCRLKIENFRVIPADYVITLSAKKVLHLKNEERKLQYWLALDPKSVISNNPVEDSEEDEIDEGVEETPAPVKAKKAVAKKAPEPVELDDDEETDEEEAPKPAAKKAVKKK
jgi:hypothetical protein